MRVAVELKSNDCLILRMLMVKLIEDIADFPDRLVQCLQKRMTEIERIARFIIKNDPGIKHEFKEALLSIRSRFSGKNATNIKRVF